MTTNPTCCPLLALFAQTPLCLRLSSLILDSVSCAWLVTIPLEAAFHQVLQVLSYDVSSQSQVNFTNLELDELKVLDTVICTYYIISGKRFFKPVLSEKPAGTIKGSESAITGSLVRDFRTAIEYGGVPEFLIRLRNRGHRLIARWGEEILLETSGNQRTWS